MTVSSFCFSCVLIWFNTIYKLANFWQFAKVMLIYRYPGHRLQVLIHPVQFRRQALCQAPVNRFCNVFHIRLLHHRFFRHTHTSAVTYRHCTRSRRFLFRNNSFLYGVPTVTAWAFSQPLRWFVPTFTAYICRFCFHSYSFHLSVLPPQKLYP